MKTMPEDATDILNQFSRHVKKQIHPQIAKLCSKEAFDWNEQDWTIDDIT